jgi:hypothetical protein
MHILILTEPVLVGAKITNARYLFSFEPVGWGMLKSKMHDILILTEPVELVGMLKSQLKCTIS